MEPLIEVCSSLYTLGFIALAWAYRERSLHWFLSSYEEYRTLRGAHGWDAKARVERVRNVQRAGWALVGGAGVVMASLAIFSLLRWLARFMF